MRRKVGVTLLFLLSLAPAGLAAQQAESQRRVYDGAWWLSAGNWEQYGFLSGYVDCHAFEFRGKIAFTKPVQAYADMLNAFYQQNAENKKLAVTDALDRLRNAAGETSAPPPPPGRATPEPHGSYDGHFWFDAETPAVQLGFVEGYLACHTAKLKDADGRFSKAPEEYVALINEAYGITDDTEEIDPEKGAEKIANVLHRFREAAPGSS